ncbi:MAG TPA: hypothetical protein VMV13_12110 [Candidatus Binataceae bacterium]|nr:hypothetical protein [Candidatus Binataceae bacterium]
MKRAWFILFLCSISACGVVQHDAADLRADNTSMTAASQKIIVSEGSDVAGHSKISTLGAVEGYCEKDPTGNTQAIPGDSMRLAAYRQYGDRVDAITGAHGWFVPAGDETSGVYEPGSHQGYWECGGTAVSFTPAPSPQR